MVDIFCEMCLLYDAPGIDVPIEIIIKEDSNVMFLFGSEFSNIPLIHYRSQWDSGQYAITILT